MVSSTARRSLTISGEVEPDADVTVRLLRAKGNGGHGWEREARTVRVRGGEFAVRVTLRDGENDFKLVASSPRAADASLLVAISR